MQDCTIPLGVTTGELRGRLQKDPAAFHSTMLRLGGRIASALKDKLEFEWEDFKQTLAERAEEELEEELGPAEEAAVSASAASSAASASAASSGDPVFERARQAQEATLRRTAMKFIDKLGKAKYTGKRGHAVRGLDGFLLCEKWEVELKWDGRAGRKYSADAAPRGSQAVCSVAIDDDEDEYSSSGEGRSLAEAAGIPIWAITRRKKQARPAMAPSADEPKGKRACGAKKRLQQTLGCEIVYRCSLCKHPMRAARQVSSLADHRNGKLSCVRAIAKYSLQIYQWWR